MLISSIFLCIFLCIFNVYRFFKQKIIYFVLFLLVLLLVYSVYRYYNKLELVDKFEYNEYVFEEYIDWSRSTGYYMKFKDRAFEDNYYIIKKNQDIYFKYVHNFNFVHVYDAFTFHTIEQDSLVLIQKAGSGKYGVVFLKMPLNKDKITKKDVRIIAIYVDILKNGKQVTLNDTTVYLLDDYKKVPKEVIDYEHVISDY